MEPVKLGCVIMASGLGRRFGGNKLMADFGGAPMISRVLDATDGIFDRRIVVTRHANVEAFCKEKGVPVVVHDLPHRSDTVRLGLQTVGTELDGCLFCPADQPLLSRETILSFAQSAEREKEVMWRAACGDVFGAPVLFPKWAFPELLTLPEGKGGNVLVKKYPEQVHAVSVRDERELWDVDTPEDLERLLLVLKGSFLA